MDARTNERYRKRLHELREALIAEGSVEIEPIREGLEPTEKLDEDAAPLTEMNQVIASNRNRLRTRRLQQIAEALERLEEEPGDFGLCESCDEPIPPRRMELQPWVRLCITCQSEQEEQDAPGSRKHLTDYR